MKNLAITLLVFLSFVISPNLFAQNVSVNADGSLADTSAMLDVSSTTKGFLLPRMTTTQQNSVILPAKGLTIFNTTLNSIMINTGSALSPVWSGLAAGAIDTSSIANFSVKVRSLFSSTAPITYSNGLIGITHATTSTNGYLSSTDWNTFNNKGNNTGGTANASDLTVAQVNAMLPVFTSTLNGLAPLSGGGTTNFLRADGTWAALPAALGSWSVTGNAGTTSTTNFIGTTDDKSFKIETNDTQGFLLDSLGNVGIGTSPVFTSGNGREKFLVDAGSLNGSGTNTLIGASATKDDYVQFNIQNLSNGSLASSDIVATANNGSASTVYIDMGINSNGYSSGLGNILNGSNTAYLYATGSDFYIGNGATGKDLIFFTNSSGTTGADGTERARITSGALQPGSNNSYSLGTSSLKWTAVYATNGTIQTSDRRLKTNISDLKYGLKEVLA